MRFIHWDYLIPAAAFGVATVVLLITGPLYCAAIFGTIFVLYTPICWKRFKHRSYFPG